MSAALIKSADVQGMPVVGLEAAKLGTARELFVDLTSGAIGFVVVEQVGLLGGNGKYHPVPWSAVRFDPIAKSLQIEVAKDDFKASPSYDRDQLSNASYGWEDQASRYFLPASA